MASATSAVLDAPCSSKNAYVSTSVSDRLSKVVSELFGTLRNSIGHCRPVIGHAVREGVAAMEHELGALGHPHVLDAHACLVAQAAHARDAGPVRFDVAREVHGLCDELVAPLRRHSLVRQVLLGILSLDEPAEAQYFHGIIVNTSICTYPPRVQSQCA